MRTWLEGRPEEMARIREERPEGPLAISHRSGKTRQHPGNPRRYDHIYATRTDFRVDHVEYLYDQACAAGSDHAVVIADLRCNVEGHPD